MLMGSMCSNRETLQDNVTMRTQKLPKGTPQSSMDAFWRAFMSKHPGTVHQILPKNPYAASKSAAEPKGLVSACSVQESYHAARKECIDTVDKIVQECKRCNLRYRDPHFDIEWDLKLNFGMDCLYGLSLPPGYERADRPRAVKRVNQIFEDPHFFIEGPSTSDIRQGLSDDCWFLAALGSLGCKPSLIQDICVAYNEEVGVYGFVFHRDGEWIYTVVDDKLYLKMSDWDESKIEKKEWARLSSRNDSEEEYKKIMQTGSRALYFAGCTDPNETWLPLLEKAFAKAHGDYKSIDGGFVGEAVEDLTGGVATEMFTADIMDIDKFWTEELLLVNEQFLFGCATGRFDDWQGGGRFTDRKGIQPSHAYSIMAACEVKGKRLLKIRNPWGQTEWSGPWSDGSQEWNAEWLELLGHKFGNDGIFWIEYKDWLKKFHFIDRTRLFDKRWSIAQQWVSLQVPWSADYHATKFTFTLDRKGPVVVVLSQLDDRYWSDFKGEYIFSLHFRINRAGKPEDYLVRSHGNYFMKRSVSTEVDLEAGTYDVRMKVSAYRVPENPPISTVVKDTVSHRQDKFIQVAMSYDLAHAKGLVIETKEEKQERIEQKSEDAIAAKADTIASAKKLKRELWEKKKRTTELMKKREVHRTMHWHRQAQRESENRREDSPREEQHLQNGGTPNKSRSSRRNRNKHNSVSGGAQTPQPENFEPQGRWEDTPNRNFDNAQTAQDRIDEFNIQQTSGNQQPADGGPVHQNHTLNIPQRHGRGGPIPVSPLMAETVVSYTSSVDSVLDAHLFSARNDDYEVQEGQFNDDDLNDSDVDSDLAIYAANSWNAVCVVGLRLYTQNGQATIKVVRQEDDQIVNGEEVIINGSSTDLAGSQVLVQPAPLDVDDQVKGLSTDVQSPTSGDNETARLPVSSKETKKQDEHTSDRPDNQENGQGRRRDRRGRRGRGRGQSQAQPQSQPQSQPQIQVQNQARNAVQRSGQNPRQSQPQAQSRQGQNQNQNPPQRPAQIMAPGLIQIPNLNQVQNQNQNQNQGRRQDRRQGQRQGLPQGLPQGPPQAVGPGLMQFRGMNYVQAPNQNQGRGTNHGRHQSQNYAQAQGRRQDPRRSRGFSSI